jgi:putative transcriptional regulator
MIRCKLLQLMANKGIRQISTLAEETGINRKTLTFLVENKIKRYDADVLSRLCKYFGCQVGDILEYVKD